MSQLKLPLFVRLNIYSYLGTKELIKVCGQSKSERESVAQNIDSDTMSKYAEIYEARKGLVVAEILDNSCEGCGAMVPPQSINEALSQNIVFCGNCSRFLFKSEN